MSRGTWRSWAGPTVFVLFGLQPVLGQEHLPAPALAPPPPPPANAPVSAAICDSCAPCKEWLFGGGFWVDGSFLYLQPRRRAQDFAIVDPNTAGTAVGDIRSADWASNAGYQVGLGYRIGNNGWFISTNYTYFHSNTDVVLGKPAGGTLIATMTHPGFVDLVDTANAASNLNYNVIDLNIGRVNRVSDTFQLAWSAGGRFAWIDQNFNVYYNGQTATNAQVSSPINFNGAGLRVAGDAQWLIAGGFGLYANGAGSLLAGDFHTYLYEANGGGSAIITDVFDRFRKVVPVAELGMGAVYQREHVRLRLGYYITNWFGLVDSPDIVHDFSNKLSHRVSDLSLDGLLLQALFAY